MYSDTLIFLIKLLFNIVKVRNIVGAYGQAEFDYNILIPNCSSEMTGFLTL
jgi:hypothetical protein